MLRAHDQPSPALLKGGTVLPQQIGYPNRCFFSAAAPLTADSFHLIGFKAMDSNAESAFLTALKREHLHEHVVVVLDNAPYHRRKNPKALPGLSLVHLPPLYFSGSET